MLKSNGTSIDNAQDNFNNLSLGNGTLDIRVFLYTSNSFVTPDINNILITSDTGYETEGYYESTEYQPVPTYFKGVLLNTINYDVEKPENTLLTIQIRGVNTVLEHEYTIYNNKSKIQSHGDIIQWKGTFISDGRYTPKIKSVEITFRTLVLNYK